MTTGQTRAIAADLLELAVRIDQTTNVVAEVNDAARADPLMIATAAVVRDAVDRLVRRIDPPTPAEPAEQAGDADPYRFADLRERIERNTGRSVPSWDSPSWDAAVSDLLRWMRDGGPDDEQRTR